ncbi:MAG: helix-turn-helix transcriptional regulator [Rhodoferax sp.]|nr:helix-turn-helix transcriptional regulator [Rhodoferax sp.]
MNLQLFFERLKAERQNLGLNQDDMAKKVGVSKRSYCAYEAGETAPSAKLLASLALMGVDIAYILTGQRTGGASAATPARAVSEGDRILLDNFHSAPEAVQSGIKTALGAFASAAGSAKRRKAG